MPAESVDASCDKWVGEVVWARSTGTSTKAWPAFVYHHRQLDDALLRRLGVKIVAGQWNLRDSSCIVYWYGTGSQFSVVKKRNLRAFIPTTSPRKSKRLERAIEIATQEYQRPWHQRVAWNHKDSENGDARRDDDALPKRERQLTDKSVVHGAMTLPPDYALPQCKRQKTTEFGGLQRRYGPIGARVYVHYDDIDGDGTARWVAGRCVDVRSGPYGEEFKVEYERTDGVLEYEWESLNEGSVYICDEGAVPFGQDVELDLADESDTSTAIFAANTPHGLPTFLNHVLLRCA